MQGQICPVHQQRIIPVISIKCSETQLQHKAVTDKSDIWKKSDGTTNTPLTDGPGNG
jgi:hypothetical protein